jgi:hypothetical protein
MLLWDLGRVRPEGEPGGFTPFRCCEPFEFPFRGLLFLDPPSSPLSLLSLPRLPLLFLLLLEEEAGEKEERVEV